MSAKERTGSARFEQVRRDIEGWRSSRAKLGPMPEALWAAATRAAQEVGLYPVARALGLNYEALKQRVSAATGRRPATPPRLGCASFVELTHVARLNGGSAEGMVVEVTSADGARLTLRLKGGAPDVAALISAFRGQG